ncbi:cytochrome c family protein [delta proteobacterium NaphS2]|nr:cytochrome c family protein [delta proteobacterium NaphS2]
MSPISNWCRCTSCHAGYGWKDENFDFTDPARIDCLVCHDTTGTYTKTPTDCGREKQGLDLVQIAQRVGLPTRANCGSCHWVGGGGDGVKHGDLDSTLKNPTASQDVHMGGQDFTCQECHVTLKHKISGDSTTSSVSEGRVSCTDCHDEKPHNDDHPLLKTLNDHCDTIACQTCHIPTFARDKPTLMFWDWSKAGKSVELLPNAPNVFTAYNKKKGVLIKRKDVQPVYAWYNGKHRRYLTGEPVNQGGVTDLNPPVGNISDPTARITPYKLFSGIQPADAEYGTLIVPKLWEGFWTHFDWNRAATDGMKEAGLKYSGKIKFVNTLMYWRINHGVVPKQKALSCTHCHRPDGVMDFEALGYPNDPAISGGRFKKEKP